VSARAYDLRAETQNSRNTLSKVKDPKKKMVPPPPGFPLLTPGPELTDPAPLGFTDLFAPDPLYLEPDLFAPNPFYLEPPDPTLRPGAYERVPTPVPPDLIPDPTPFPYALPTLPATPYVFRGSHTPPITPPDRSVPASACSIISTGIGTK
jgi:hypothetical protein